MIVIRIINVQKIKYVILIQETVLVKKGAVGKKILSANATSKSSDTNETKATTKPATKPKATTKPKSKTKENKNCNEGFICPEDKIYNPDTGKCVSKKGVVGKKILSGTNDKKKAILISLLVQRRIVMKILYVRKIKYVILLGKCVKKDGKIGKELVSNQQKGGKTVLLKM